MDKSNFTAKFALRLRDAMLTGGYISFRSTSGVNIHKLVEMTGHSPQICRKYLSGHAIPEPLKLADLAHKLNVDPGWLLFGDKRLPCSEVPGQVTLSQTLLHYLVTQGLLLYQTGFEGSEIADFLIELARDLSQIAGTEEQSKQIIDLAISSIRQFQGR
jgi:hypothetical protein